MYVGRLPRSLFGTPGARAASDLNIAKAYYTFPTQKVFLESALNVNGPQGLKALADAVYSDPAARYVCNNCMPHSVVQCFGTCKPLQAGCCVLNMRLNDLGIALRQLGCFQTFPSQIVMVRRVRPPGTCLPGLACCHFRPQHTFQLLRFECCSGVVEQRGASRCATAPRPTEAISSPI